MSGNHALQLPEPRFLVDESLTPRVAQALQLVGYDIVDVATALRYEGASDPEIIAWCQANGAVWVHADDRARRQHKELLQTSGIRTMWVYRKGGAMTGREQLRILASVLPMFLENLKVSPSIRHYKAAAANAMSRPTLTVNRV